MNTPEPTRPSVARIYDYMLGGTHNYAIDRAIGDRFAARLPDMAQAMRLNRWFLSYTIEQFAQRGITCYIDLATGLPTEGYIHELLPDTARIIYNDHDPEVVAYARQIIGERPNIRYLQTDLRKIDTILEEAEALFGSERRIGISLVGVAYFIDDDSLRHVFQRLYDWAAPGSLLALTTFVADENNAGYREMSKVYAEQMISVYPRSAEELVRLAGPWGAGGNTLEHVERFVEESLQTTILPINIGYAGILEHG